MSQVLTDQPLQGAVFVSVLLNCTPAYKSKYKHINFPVQDCLRVIFMFINNIPWEFGKFCFYFYRIAVSFTILKELRGLIKTSPLDFFLKWHKDCNNFFQMKSIITHRYVYFGHVGSFLPEWEKQFERFWFQTSKHNEYLREVAL